MARKAERTTRAMLERNKCLRRERNAPRTAGMTLLELLVVMALLAMLAGLFPLALQRMVPARRLTTVARTLVVDLRDLQSRAALAGVPLKLTVDSEGYGLQQVARDSSTHVRLPPDVRMTLKESSHTQPITTLIMYPDGSSSGGEFELRIEQRLAKIDVSSLTGRVHVAP